MPIYSLDDAMPDLPSPDRYWVAPDAQVIGRVRLGVDVGIWFGAVLRGDNEWIDVGEGTNVQEHSLLHTDKGLPLNLGAHCTVGHHAILHSCTVGPHSLIGMGATLLNGCRIGAYSLVGAGALVTEGKEFPDYSLIVGAPAKAVRTLDAAAVERIAANTRNYVGNWKRYAAGLRRLD